MQCLSCNAVYSNDLNSCPRCKTSATKLLSLELDDIEDTFDNIFLASIESNNVVAKETLSTSKQTNTAPVAKPSTLIEFPKNKQRQNLPEWRKELLEKFKEIQERREREGKASSSEEAEIEQIETLAVEIKKTQLEVVPPAPPPAPVNPIVAAALARIEKAHSKTVASRLQTRHAAALAVAALPEEEQEQQLKVHEQRLTLVQPQATQAVSQPPVAAKVMHAGVRAAGAQRQDNHIPISRTSIQTVSQTQTATAARALAVEPMVQAEEMPVQQEPNSSAIISKPIQDRIKTSSSNGTAAAAATAILLEPEFELEEIETEFQVNDGELYALPGSNDAYTPPQYDDYAPFIARVVCVFFDLSVVAFATSPFAAILQLSGVDWSNSRVLMALGAISLIVSFAYLMTSVAMIGKTWGMAVISLRVADDENGYSPTIKQSSVRALLFLLSVAALGLPFIYALFDAEGRALHDRIAGTIVVKED